jgi:hypothetical protein
MFTNSEVASRRQKIRHRRKRDSLFFNESVGRSESEARAPL